MRSRCLRYPTAEHLSSLTSFRSSAFLLGTPTRPSPYLTFFEHIFNSQAQVVTFLERFHIRTASLSDLPAISGIEDDSFPDPYPLSLLKRLINDYSESFFVAVDHRARLVGYCVSSLGSSSAHLISIAVDREFRGNGIATMLLQRTIGYLIAHAAREFYLEVNPKNVEAVGLYRKLGFEKAGLLKEYYSDGSDAIMMKIILDPHICRDCGG
jgi:ribosomal-protein-alanine N-acetyltransferase